MKTKSRFHKLTAWLLTLAMLMTFIPSFTLTVSAADDTTTAIYVSETGSGTEDGSKESPYTTLQAAFNATKSGGNYEIILLSDITVSDAVGYWNSGYQRYDPLKYSATANVTLKSDSGSNPYTVYRDCDKYMIQLAGKDASNPLTLTLKDIVIDGQSENYTSEDKIFSLIYVSYTELYIESGTTLQNNTNTSGTGDGGAITLQTGSSLVMNGGTIQYCKAYYGGGIYSPSNSIPITINDGLFQDNEATADSAGTNEVNALGGGAIFTCGVLKISGGTFRYNKAVRGGAILNRQQSDPSVISGNAIIENNTASKHGGGIYSDYDFTISGGIIRNNHADGRGGGIFHLSGNGKLTLEGGSVSGNTEGTDTNKVSSGVVDYRNYSKSKDTLSNTSSGVYISSYVFTMVYMSNSFNCADTIYTNRPLRVTAWDSSLNNSYKIEPLDTSTALSVSTTNGRTLPLGNFVVFGENEEIKPELSKFSSEEYTLIKKDTLDRFIFYGTPLTSPSISLEESENQGEIKYIITPVTSEIGTISGYEIQLYEEDGITKVGEKIPVVELSGTLSVNSGSYKASVRAIDVKKNSNGYIVKDITKYCESEWSNISDVVTVEGPHEHSWIYEKQNDTTIKATCTADGCSNTDGGSITIAAPDSLIYTGRAIEAKVTNELVDTTTEVNVVYTAASGSELTSNKPVNIGTYTATLTIDNVSVSVEYDITANLVLNTNGGTINNGDLEYYTEGETTALPTDITKDSCAFAGWYENAEFTGSAVLEIPSTATGKKEYYAKWIEKVTFKVENNEHIYQTDKAQSITVKPNSISNSLTADDFYVKYYKVDENENKLASTTAVTNAVETGKYLYVIDFTAEKDYSGYTIEKKFTVTDTTLPDISAYHNIGYMFIKSGITGQQTPIYFKDGTVNLKVGGTYTNELTDENTENTVTYKSSNESIVTVDETTGEIKAIGKGTATITATSTKDETTPVYASYTVNVGLATVTLTANDFTVTAKDKTYDGTNEVVISATVKSEALYTGDNIKVDITGYFVDENAADNKTVNYKITGISGTGAENYVLENGKIESTTTANISKATVTIICATTTTRTFDGTPQSIDVSAMANGAVFDSSNYTVKYAGGDAPSAVGSYDITVKLTEEAAENYIVADFDATLIIKSASQEVFSIEGVPEAVYYGDSFTLSTDGASGTVTYAITSGAEFAELDGADVTVKGVGKVTITATSVKDGHTDRVATKSFNAKQKVLTPTATATGRTYNGENGVNVEITLAGIVNSDAITAEATGTMLNADAGKNKIVYVSGITLDGAKKDLYTLDTTSVQTMVNIAKKKIAEITVSASDKKYDGNKNATATVETITGIFDADAGQVEVIGSAVFADENVAYDDDENVIEKAVTFTATSLAGAKAANYYIDGTLTAETTATISPVTVNFVVGQTSFVYDGKDKEITLSASDEFGRIFSKDDYTVEYNETPNAAGTYTATIKFNDENGNYTTTQGDITVTIEEATQDNLVIVGLPGTIQYGDSFELEAVGGEDGGTYEWTVKDGADITLSATDTATTTVTIGDVVGEKVEIEVTKKTDNYEDISAKVVFVPTAKVVTFDISNLEQTYNGEEKEIEVDTEATTYTVTYNGSNDKPVNAGTYTVKVEATDNYSGMQTATLIIKKATATGTITGIAGSYTYGEVVTGVSVTDLKANTEAKITYAGTGIYVPQDTPPTKVGNYTVIAEITGDNYETLTLTKNFKIEKATLTVKAVDAERAYGEANPIFVLEYKGFVNGETKDVLLAEPIATVDANASSRVGDYEIKVSGGSAENYAFSYDKTGKLTVKAADGGSLYITGSTNTAYVNDVFTLHAFYGNSKVNVTWESNNSDIAEIAENGTVTAKSAGTVIITAKADKNYGEATATFELTVKQTGITLVPTGLVKTYTGERQDITFAETAGFTPVLSGEGKNVNVTYTLISNPSVTEPIQAGTYSVVYTISDGSYTGGGNTTMYINKATVTAKVKDDSKVYGDEYTGYDLEITNNGGLAESVQASTLEELKGLTTFTSEGAAKTAIVKEGGYEITPTLSKSETDNVIFTVANGTLTVTKAPLTVTVKNVSREYGAENPTLEAEYTGFKNEENENTENIFTGELVLAYDESINAETAVGVYENKTTASGIEAANYDITFVQGKVTITKIPVTASAGTSRSSYLTVKFDKAVEGITFTVTDGTNPVEITEVTASSDNKTYTLKGSFSTSVTYTVTPALTSETHEITSEALSIKPSSGGSSGGGGGGSSAPTTYTVKFETNGGSEIDSVKITKNNTVSEPTEPTKDGYTFDGWYTDKELTKAYDFDTKVTKAITLYAKWTENKVDDTDDKTDDKTDTPDTPVWENPFTDVNADDWYYENVEYAVENGLFNGTTETTFAPNGIITRAMMVTVLYRAEGEPTVTGTATFEDVDSNAYYAKAVVWGQQNGIIKGYSETEFAPDQNITREQIAAIMHRYAQYKGYDVSVGENTNILSYDDFDSISEYAIASMQYACGSGLMKGKTTSTLNPKDNATRAEIAAILHRFIEANK